MSTTLPRPSCAAFVATSLDGFIARDDGAIDWLDAANRRLPAGEDCGWHDFVARIDTLVLGRVTFEHLLRLPQWPYAGTPVVVAARGPVAVPAALRFAVQVSSDAPTALVQRLGRAGRRRLCVDGGSLISAFLREGLLDEITVTTLPVLIGRGRRLFRDAGEAGVFDRGDLALEHRSTRAWPFGFVQSTWRVLPPRPAESTPTPSHPHLQET